MLDRPHRLDAQRLLQQPAPLSRICPPRNKCLRNDSRCIYPWSDMPRKRQVPPANEFSTQCERLWRWLVENAGADPKRKRLYEGWRILDEEAPGGWVHTKAGAVASAFVILQQVGIERPKSTYYRQMALHAGDEAAELERIANRLAKSLTEFAQRAHVDRESHADDYERAGGMLTHWPSEIAQKMQVALCGLDVAITTAAAVRAVAREIPEHLLDADMSDERLSNIESAALRLCDGGFSAAEIAELMDIDEKKGDPASLKTDRWRKIVERARRKVEPDKSFGTSASVAISAEIPQPCPHATPNRTSRTTSSPNRGARREPRTAPRRRSPRHR